MPEVVSQPGDLQPGDIFEGCRYHRQVNAVVRRRASVGQGENHRMGVAGSQAHGLKQLIPVRDA